MWSRMSSGLSRHKDHQVPPHLCAYMPERIDIRDLILAKRTTHWTMAAATWIVPGLVEDGGARAASLKA